MNARDYSPIVPASQEPRAPLNHVPNFGHLATASLPRVHPNYTSWWAMKSRCIDPKNASYARYGGAGISVCARWLNFHSFVDDMGVKPTKTHQIDRINSLGNYEPGNCRWATPQEQSRNRSTNVLVTLLGETKCLSEWATQFGIEPGTLGRRINRGLPYEQLIRKTVHQTTTLAGSYRTSVGTYSSAIRVHGKRVYLGCFATAEEAHEAYEKAKQDRDSKGLA